MVVPLWHGFRQASTLTILLQHSVGDGHCSSADEPGWTQSQFRCADTDKRVRNDTLATVCPDLSSYTIPMKACKSLIGCRSL